MPQRRQPSPRDRGESLSTETDIVVFLIRAALIIVLSAAPALRGWPVESLGPLVRLGIVVATAYTVLIAIGWYYAGMREMFLQRPLALVVDMLLITVGLASLPHPATEAGTALQREYYVALYQVYYIPIMVAAVWYGLPGAMITAIGAIAAWSSVRAATDPLAAWPPALSTELVWVSGAPFLVFVAFVSGYLTTLMRRESARAAQLDQEMALARRLQDAIFPEVLPEIPGFDLGLAFQPARHIGGDLYDVAPLEDGRFLVAVGDMAGKSVQGVIHLSLVHSHLRAAARGGLSPGQIATYVNSNAYEALQPEGYASLFIGIIDPTTGILSFANCGHVPPLLLRAGQCEDRVSLATGGIVIGATAGTSYDEKTVLLEPGDIVLLFTDGVPEARGRGGAIFGEQRVCQAALAAASGAQSIAETVLAASQRFALRTGGDDVTLLVLRREFEELSPGGLTPADGEPAPDDPQESGGASGAPNPNATGSTGHAPSSNPRA